MGMHCKKFSLIFNIPWRGASQGMTHTNTPSRKDISNYEAMVASPIMSISAIDHEQSAVDSKYDTAVDIPDQGTPTQRSWKELMREYRALEFGATVILYSMAGVFAAIDVTKRPIPGIRVRLNSTDSWSLDPAIGEKEKPQQVPMWLLLILGVCLPIGTNLVVNYALPKYYQVRVIAHDTRDFVLCLFQSMALGAFLTQFIKNQTGRFRPCFYDMCRWNHDVIWDGVTNLCTSTSGEKEARKSFPSGHASFSWSTMLVLTLYLLGRSRLNCTGRCSSMLRGGKKSVMMFMCCAPLLLAAWICITRSIDNWHHYSDILAGSIIGAVSAIFSFSSHYGPIFSWRYAGLPLETIHERLDGKQGLAGKHEEVLSL